MRKAILEGLVPEFANAPLPNLMGNITGMGNMGGGMGYMGGMGNMGNMGGVGNMGGMGGMGGMYNMGGVNRMGYGGQMMASMNQNRSMVARGGQLVVAGSVVGQWGANFGGQSGKLAGNQRVRGNRGGKKNKDKKVSFHF